MSFRFGGLSIYTTVTEAGNRGVDGLVFVGTRVTRIRVTQVLVTALSGNGTLSVAPQY